MTTEPDMKYRRKRPANTTPRIGRIDLESMKDTLAIGALFLDLGRYRVPNLLEEGVIGIFRWN